MGMYALRLRYAVVACVAACFHSTAGSGFERLGGSCQRWDWSRGDARLGSRRSGGHRSVPRASPDRIGHHQWPDRPHQQRRSVAGNDCTESGWLGLSLRSRQWVHRRRSPAGRAVRLRELHRAGLLQGEPERFHGER